MCSLRYSITIEATDDPSFFTFYSPDLDGFSGAGTSAADCIQKAEAAISEHLQALREFGLPIPAKNPDPRVRIEMKEADVELRVTEL